MKGIKFKWVFLFVMILSGCNKEDDLVSYVQKVNKRPSSQIEPLPPMKVFENYVYSASALRSPFQPPMVDLKIAKGEGPDVNRPKEALEAFPLDSLRLVGALQKKGILWALIVDKSGMIHHLRVGNHLGQNSGRINKILEDKIELIETVADSQGRWQKKPATMNLLQ